MVTEGIVDAGVEVEDCKMKLDKLFLSIRSD